MHVGTVNFFQIATFLIVLSLGLPLPSEAGVFWEDNFENHLTPNWDTGACGGSPQDGCNASISTDIAHGGTHSLKSDYPSSNNLFLQGAGTSIKRNTTASREVWMRFYYRTVNFQYGRDVTKHFILRGVYWMNIFGSREMGANVITPVSVTCPNNSVDQSCNYFPNIASIPLNDNQWYCIETHLRSSTPQSALNGQIQIFVDGTRTLDYNNIATYDTSTQNNLLDHYTQYGWGKKYIDDLAVGDARIGCSGSPNLSPPQNLKVQ